MSRKGWIYLLLAIVSCGVVLAPVALAQDGADGGGEEQAKGFVGQIFDSFIAILIVLLSVVSGALIIEHFMTLRRDKLIPPDILADIEVLFEEEEFGEAMDICDADPTMLTNVMAAVIPKIGAGYDVMSQTMKDASEEEAIKLHQKISWLSLIGNIGPMMGLLGTVTGMIAAFRVIAQSEEAPSPKDLAAGISTALITTTLGLIVAIPVMSFFFFFRNKIVRISMDLSAICDDLIERFRPAE